MRFIDELKEEYLRRCADYCDHGGYTLLSINKEKLRHDLAEQYGMNGDREKVLNQVRVLEEIVFNYLDELDKQKIRCLMWLPDERHKQELNRRFSTALQEA